MIPPPPNIHTKLKAVSKLYKKEPPPKRHLVQPTFQQECGYQCWAFLKILDEEFPECHVFHKIFNRNTLQISYSYMPNLMKIIYGRNKSTLQKTTAPPILKACNYRRPADWPKIAWDHTWYTKQQCQWRTASQTKLISGSPRPRLKIDLQTTNLLSKTPARDLVQSSVNTFGIWKRQSWSSGSPGNFENKPLPLALSRTAVICVCGRNILSIVDLN